jgi:hypothetical protein
MSTDDGIDKGVGKGVRILSLGMHLYSLNVPPMMLTALIKIVEVLEPTPSSSLSKNTWLDWPMIFALTSEMSTQQITST